MKKEEKKIPDRASGINFWMLTTIILGIACIGIGALYLTSPPSSGQDTVVSITSCSMKMMDYINTNLVQSGTLMTLNSTAERNGVYELVTSYQGKTITVFASRDCKLLFLDYVDMTSPVPTPTTPGPTPTIVKTDKPVADLYVMAFCPYGVQAENTMKPVVDLLGDKMEMNVRFIANVKGNNLTSVSSLHGLNEATEDVRQLCIKKKYPASFWAYVMTINEKCYPEYRNTTRLEECWNATASGLGMNTTEIASCVNGEEGLILLKSDESFVKKNSVTGSPTLIINGVRYSGARTSDAFKQAICNAFVNPPAECSVALNSTTTPSSGQC